MLYGGAGYCLKWGLSLLSSRAADVRQAMKLLDTMSRNAEAVGHTIIAGQPDIGMSAGVMADRTNLGNALRRSLGRGCSTAVENRLALYGRSLKCADPNFGVVAQADIDAMRQAERNLHATVRQCAGDMWFWRLFKHERTA